MRLLLSLLLLLSLGASIQAETITATPTGETLQSICDRVKPGDKIIVTPGHYVGFNMIRSGSPGARIVYLAQPGAIIDKPGPKGDCINLEGASHVTIDGFTCLSSLRAGIRSVTNKSAVIRNCTCDKNDMWGIFTSYSDNVLIEDNKCSGSLNEHGIYVSHATQSPIIRGNECYSNNVNGIHLNSGVNESVIGALVEKNIVHDNGKSGGSAINCDGILDATIQDNLCYENHFQGISLYRSTSTLPATGNRVLRNVVVMSLVPGSMYALNIRNASINNEVRNNVFTSMLLDADCLPGYQASGNTISLPAGKVLYLSADSDKTHLNPLQWGVLTGETDLQVFLPEKIFRGFPAYYRLSGDR